MQHVQILLLREWHRIRGSLKDLVVNFYLIWPFLFGIGSGYLAPLTYFGVNPKKATMLFVGMILLQLVIVAHDCAMHILAERTGANVLQYHVTVSSFMTVFVVRSLFSVLFCIALMMPFLPIVKIFLGSYFYTVHTSWPLVVAATALGSLLSVSYALVLSSFISDMTQSLNIWVRFIEPLMWFGGMWVPLFAIYKALPLAGRIARYNPFMYVTEMIRSAVLGDAIYTSPLTCSVIIVGTSIMFFMLSYYLLKKKIDAV